MWSSTILTVLSAVMLLASPANSQSNVTGDTGKGPYGIPRDKFQKALEASGDPSASTYPVPGYRVDTPPDGANVSTADDGWRLGIGVYPAVPLSDAEDAGIRSKYSRVTTLSLGHEPAAVDMDMSWRLCATVYEGLTTVSSGEQQQQQLDGTCAQVLPSDCLKQLQVQAESRGIDARGRCSSPGVPSKCAGHIVGNGTAFAISADMIFNETIFTYASAPADKDDKHAIDRALGNVWPVVLTWAQADAAGTELRFANAHAACVRAASNQTSTGGGNGTNPDKGNGVAVVDCSGVVWWAVSLAAAVAGYLL